MSNILNTDDDNDDEATEQNQNTANLSSELIEELNNLHKIILNTGKVTIKDLKNAYLQSLEDEEITTATTTRRRTGVSSRNVPSTNRNTETDAITQSKMNLIYAFCFLVFIMILTPIVCEVIQFLLGVRCLVPNNYLVWEATRPISDCGFCRSVRAPLVLKNLTRDEFEPFAYSSQPIIIKNAVSHWPAIKSLNFSYLKNLYESIPGALDEECQFLHFRSDFMSLREVFQMSEERSKYNNGRHKPWYVGWSNCHPIVLEELRKLYPRPHFLPEDAEMPNTDYIFLGYEQGAIMHLDYIPRLMWQAQLQGNKSWILAPTPECDQICHTFSFYVEPGDAVLVDTRIWYHGTSIPKGQFALTIQSEYG